MSKLAKPLRFTHLYLENWKNFTRVETDLARRVVVAGPNASGKSNLLDAIRRLIKTCSIDKRRLGASFATNSLNGTPTRLNRPSTIPLKSSVD